MEDSERDKPKGVPDAKTAPARGKQVRSAFDTWLHRELHEIFDPIAKEPIPEEILRLIKKKDPPPR